MPRDLLLFPMPFPVDVMFYFEDIRPLSREGSFFESQFQERRQPTDFGQAFSNLAQFRTCGTVWLSSVQ